MQHELRSGQTRFDCFNYSGSDRASMERGWREANCKALAERAETHEVAKRLCVTAGAVAFTGISFVTTVDRVKRFSQAKQVRTYLGQVPWGLCSRERQHRGHIADAGDRRMRVLLVEKPSHLLGRRLTVPDTIRTWSHRIALARGKPMVSAAPRWEHRHQPSRALSITQFAPLWSPGGRRGAHHHSSPRDRPRLGRSVAAQRKGSDLVLDDFVPRADAAIDLRNTPSGLPAYDIVGEERPKGTPWDRSSFESSP